MVNSIISLIFIIAIAKEHCRAGRHAHDRDYDCAAPPDQSIVEKKPLKPLKRLWLVFVALPENLRKEIAPASKDPRDWSVKAP